MTTPVFGGTVRDDGSLALIVIDGAWKHSCFEVSDIVFSDNPSYEEDGKMYSDINCNINEVELRKDGVVMEEPTDEQLVEFRSWLRIHLGKFMEDALVSALELEAEDKYTEDDNPQNE